MFSFGQKTALQVISMESLVELLRMKLPKLGKAFFERQGQQSVADVKEHQRIVEHHPRFNEIKGQIQKTKAKIAKHKAQVRCARKDLKMYSIYRAHGHALNSTMCDIRCTLARVKIGK